MHMRLMPVRFRVTEALAELDAHPELWNQYPHRTQGTSPHREADDIWVRYNDPANLGPHFADPHESVWYPCVEHLPGAKAIALALKALTGASKLGGVLITRVPPGKQVYWHADAGWHAAAHRKFLVLLRGGARQHFEFEGESLETKPGECFEFENQYRHRVINDSDQERISLIVCLRDFHD